MDSYKFSSESDLNDFFQAMSEVDEEETEWKRFTDYLVSKVQALSTYFEHQQQNPVEIGVFGSSTEYLKCCLPNDMGDIDVMVSPVAQDIIIQEAIMEYDTGNPIFVRLRGKDHPVLKHCLAEGSDFVTTSTLKEFHSKVFGSARSVLTLIPKIFVKLNEFYPSHMSHNYILENLSGPALQLESLHSFGSITDQVQQFGMNDPSVTMGDDFRNFCEWFAVCLNPNRTFTKEHSACIDEYMETAQDCMARFNQNPSVPGFIDTMNQLTSGEKVLELRTKVEHLDNNAAENINDSCMSSSSGNGDMTPIEVTEGERCSDSLNSTRSDKMEDQAANAGVDKSKREESADSDALAQPKEDLNLQAKVMDQEEGLGAKHAQKPTLTGDKEKTEENLTEYLLENAFGGSYKTSENTNCPVEHQDNLIHVGLDLVPAFKATGWPKVAKAWIARGRAWPSPEIISKILENGFNLVVKTPKDTDRQDLNFRLSFSSAELILSGELNDIQRECYRCLKLYYRSALQQREPKIVTSYFLKTILFWTVEETGMEVWNDDNRGCCVMMLLEKLLKSIERKFLPHFFVPEFNLLEDAVNDYPQEVQYLADEVKKIYENPMEYPNVPSNQHNSDEVLPKTKFNSVEEESAAQGGQVRDPNTSNNTHFIKYQDFLEVYLKVCRELLDLLLQEDSSHEEDATVKSIIENLRPIMSKMDNSEAEMMRVLECSSQTIYSTHVLHQGCSLRQRILSALKGQSEMLAYVARQDDLLAVGNEHLIIDRMINSDSFDSNALIPQGGGELLKQIFQISSLSPAPVSKEARDDGDDIPLD